MIHYTDAQILELITSGFDGRRIALLAPIVRGRKGHYRELFESLAKKGYVYARIDGQMSEFTAGMRLDRYKTHNIDLVIDRMTASADASDRLRKAMHDAMRHGKGTMAVSD
jgi:excinuclease ABC subunit A